MDKKEYPQLWLDRVGKFAEAVGVDIEKVNEALKPVVGEPSEEAAVLFDDLVAVPDADIKEALKPLGLPTGKLNAHLTKLRPEKKAETPITETKSTIGSTLSILPTVPDETSFLEMLRTGGVLKVETTEVISAIKAALAKSVGLYELPDKIAAKMEEFAIAQEEPCGKEFYEIQKLLTAKQYGDILSAVGVTGSYVSEKRKKDFFARLDAKLWEALKSFNSQLVAWQQSWMQGMANPGIMMMAMASQGSGNPLPPGIMTPPDTAPLRTAGEEVVNEINRIFAGPGIPIARALAYDATRIMGVLENKELPNQIGAASKDQMIKDLGISVGGQIVQMEQAIIKYALSIMSLPKVTAEDEIAYFSAMLQLGNTIPWDKLGTKGLGRDLR
jgi:hypothetical protein